MLHFRDAVREGDMGSIKWLTKLDVIFRGRKCFLQGLGQSGRFGAEKIGGLGEAVEEKNAEGYWGWHVPSEGGRHCKLARN